MARVRDVVARRDGVGGAQCAPFLVAPGAGRRRPLQLRLGDDAPRTLADDVLDGLTAPCKELPPKHLYDDHGSRLFAEICELPEYYPTRTEATIFASHIGAIVQSVGAGATLLLMGNERAEVAADLSLTCATLAWIVAGGEVIGRTVQISLGSGPRAGSSLRWSLYDATSAREEQRIGRIATTDVLCAPCTSAGRA